MKKKSWIIGVIVLTILIGIGIYFFTTNMKNKDSSSYEAQKTATNEKTQEQNQTSSETEQTQNASSQEENKTKNQEEAKPQYQEEQLATFSTKIYSQDNARQNNLQITSSTLNGTIVKNGSTFSFCQTVGKATSSKGYQEADIYDHNGNKKKGLGGGNCQISSTLYNAVLAVPNLKVTERHEHSNNVPYVKKGKDAAVAYGSYDFKFINQTGNDIKINCSVDQKNVTITINSLKQI